MAHLNILSICMLVAAVASGDCFFSNLMNEPLNFAVSLLDGQGKSRPSPPVEPYTTSMPESHETPTMAVSTHDAGGVTFGEKRGRSKNILAKKLIRNSLKSKKPMAPMVEARDSSGDSSHSEEIVIIDDGNRWKKSHGHKHLMGAPISRKLRGRLDNKKGIVHSSPVRAGSNMKHRMSMKNSWMANRSGGSDEKMPKVKAIVKKQNKMAMGSSDRSGNSEEMMKGPSSEQYITRESSSSEEIIVPTARAYQRAPLLRSMGYSNRGVSRLANKMKSVRARKLKSVRARKMNRHCHICHA